MGKFVASSVTICSIYPLRLGPERRPYGEDRENCGSSIFSIPAVEKGQNPPYSLLEVADSWQRERNWDRLPGSSDAYKFELITAEQIAGDLILNWTTGLLSAAEGGHPGVGIIAGKTPTAAELKHLGEKQTKFFEALYYAAQKMAQNNDWRNITELHRQGALWLGKSVKDAAWVKPYDSNALKDCPFCASRIPNVAIFCQFCRQQVAEIPKELVFGSSEKASGPVSATSTRR